MSAHDPAKSRAARAAADLVEDGMLVGLGSGTTAAELVRRLGERHHDEGLRFIGVPTSDATRELAASYGIDVRELDEVGSLDICLDGADEIDGQFRMIKGRGGALLREKLVATEARRRVTVITAEKRVDRLGERMPLPVEVSSFGLHHTERRIRTIGAETSPRRNDDGTTYRTDGGNAIIDCRFAGIDDPEGLDALLLRLVGVFDTGLFLGMCDLLVVGHADRVEMIESHIRQLPVRPPGGAPGFT